MMDTTFSTAHYQPQKTSFAHWIKQNSFDNWRHLLANVDSTLWAMAEEAGIDWQALRSALPQEGYWLKGAYLPVLSAKDKWKSYFKWYLKTDRFGRQWPCLSFNSFRHGGVSFYFDGYRWGWDKFQQGAHLSPTTNVVLPQKKSAHLPSVVSMEQWRLKRFSSTKNQWIHSPKATVGHALLQKRLGKQLTEKLLSRIDIRSTSAQSLMVRLQHYEHGTSGFQALYAQPQCQDGRRQDYIIQKAGMKKGSLVVIRAEQGYESWPVGICEGLFTALSVAVFYKGPIAIALDAGNLKPVRQMIKRPCIFFADNDAWKSHNTGHIAAQEATYKGDRIFLPLFDKALADKKPTDFNDLLMWQGANALKQQILAAY